MNIQALAKKVEKIEKELLFLKKPKKILAKVSIDEKLLKTTKKKILDFDIEKFVTKKDLKVWK